MRPLLEAFSVVLVVGCHVTATAVTGELGRGMFRPDAASLVFCRGSYAGRMLTPEDLASVIRNHQLWLGSGGEPNDMQRANLCEANLQEANLQWANLQGANLSMANLQGALLSGTNLREAGLPWAKLQMAGLQEANLQEANLFWTNLQGADLSRANLQKANLIVAKLRGANLQEANLQKADLSQADLSGAVFEIQPASLPNVLRFALAHNLHQMTFYNSPHALIELREAFKKAGLRDQERQITYAIERTKRLLEWDPSLNPLRKDTRSWLERFAGRSESLFRYILFEFPSNYGMAPGRALQTLVLLIVLFSLPYMVAVHPFRPTIHMRKDAGIWLIWLPDRVHQEEGEAAPVRVTPTFFSHPAISVPLATGGAVCSAG